MFIFWQFAIHREWPVHSNISVVSQTDHFQDMTAHTLLDSAKVWMYQEPHESSYLWLFTVLQIKRTLGEILVPLAVVALNRARLHPKCLAHSRIYFNFKVKTINKYFCILAVIFADLLNIVPKICMSHPFHFSDDVDEWSVPNRDVSQTLNSKVQLSACNMQHWESLNVIRHSDYLCTRCFVLHIRNAELSSAQQTKTTILMEKKIMLEYQLRLENIDIQLLKL